MVACSSLTDLNSARIVSRACEIGIGVGSVCDEAKFRVQSRSTWMNVD